MLSKEKETKHEKLALGGTQHDDHKLASEGNTGGGHRFASVECHLSRVGVSIYLGPVSG
jgi:hypothetical protein